MGIVDNALIGASGQGGGYNLTRSVRLRSSASAFFNRTPASASNLKTWTWSCWVKRGTITNDYQYLFSAFYYNASPYSNLQHNIGFTDTDNLRILLFDGSTNQTNLLTSQVFRDPSAWYHIQVVWDTTQATAANRVKLYVNGTQVTAFSTATYPPQNYDGYVNSTRYHSVGVFTAPPNYTGIFYKFDGYLAEHNFIDGQALTPSSFGETDLTTGVWKAKRYNGTYGTNGFYLPFQTSNSDNIVIYYPGTLSGNSVINVEGSTNGTKGSGVTSATGKVGTGLQFDGTINAYVDTGISTNYTSAFTAAVWFKSTSTSQAILVDKSSYYAENTSAFPFRSTLNASGSISVSLDAGGDYSPDVNLTSSTSGYNDGNWHHFAVVYQGGSFVKIYVDGAEVATASISISINSVAYNWFLGRAALPYGGGSPGLPFTGTMDSFRLYSRVLSAAEVAAIYNNTNTQVGLGSDASGNANDWTPANISLAPGVTYDSMTDVPTLTSATAANFCVLNPLSNIDAVTLNSGNLNCTATGSGTGYGRLVGTIAVSSGKWYWESVVNSSNTYGLFNGIALSSEFTATYVGNTSTSYSYWGQNGNKYNNGSGSSYGATYGVNDIIGVALDLDAGTLTFYKNNVSQGVAYSGLTGSYVPAFSFSTALMTGQYSVNFGQRPFAYTPPTGYVALNTYNLPTSTIVQGNKVMDATLWTGNGSTQTITNAGTFKPDFVWIKNRGPNTGYYHILTDSVRGTNSQLFSNDYSIAETRTDRLTAFNSNGFSLGSYADVNANAWTYVGWQWQAGQGSTSSNTSGSVTSTVSVNASAGFSIVKWTGNATNPTTVGHGLGVAPQLIIIKNPSLYLNWPVYSSILGNANMVYLNLTNASGSSSFWNSTSPTSSVFTVSSDGHVNGSGNPMIAYCFTSISGYSAFGSYTGNGSTDGTFVYTGFRPRFVMVKRTDVGGYWSMKDTARDPYNVAGNLLFANVADSEYSNNQLFDINSNGFKLRGSNSDINASNGTYIYMAFAENPLKFALAR